MVRDKSPHFDKQMFAFLRALARNNKREWFTANKERYEEHVKGPLLRFINDFSPHLNKLSRHFVADPRPVGGSMFRIYRDTRFSNDKTPYKTAAAAQFRHQAGKDVHAPGFYLHLAPGEVFAGAGLWHPDARALAGVRQAIADDPAGWKRAVGAKAFRERFDRHGESLKRPPRRFDPEHPLIDEIKRKDFVAMLPLDEDHACGADFLGRFAQACKLTTPMMRFLTRAVGLPF